MSDIAGLQPKLFLGLNYEVKENVAYIGDEEIIYPVGGIMVINNYVQMRQKYIRLPDKGQNINVICISPNRKIIAVAEIGESPTISIYDPTTLKRKRQILIPSDQTSSCKEFVCLAFTFDSKSLIAISGEPDWTMYSFKADKGKFENATKVNNLNSTGIIRQMACNPNDAGVVVLVGDVIFKILALTENVWRQYGFSKADQLIFRSVAWISQTQLVAGTYDGRLFIVENGEPKCILRAEELFEINLSPKEEFSQQLITNLTKSDTSLKENYEIVCIKSFSKGLMFVYGVGTIHFYEKENANLYTKRNVFKIKEDTIVKKNNIPPNTVKCLSISPNQDHIIASCNTSQLYHAYLWGPNLNRQPEIYLKYLGHFIHRGAIAALSVCLWKPLFMTAGQEDRTLCLWNYETENLIMMKSYEEDLYGVDLHPTGLYAIVGFSGKLRFLTILIDDYAVTREISLRYCSVCKFSNTGSMFAAVNGSVIQVYSSILFENIVNLRGHNGMVTSLSWVYNDYQIISCGTEGALYHWDISKESRIAEMIDKTCSFKGVQVTKDCKIMYAVGSSGEVKEIVNSNVRLTQLINENGLDCVTLSRSNSMLFASGGQGIIYSIKLPLISSPEFIEQSLHNHTVPQIKLSYDDKCLISCSIDGSICIWKLINTAGKTVLLEKNFSVSTDILIPYRNLKEKIQRVQDLTLRIGELETEHSYEMKLIETKNSETLKQVHEDYCSAIEKLKEQNLQIENEHIQEVHSIKKEIEKLKNNHESLIQNLEATYNEKLIVEYSKFLRLEEKLNSTATDYKKQINDLEDAKIYIENKMQKELEEIMTQNEQKIQMLQGENHKAAKEHEIIKRQIEEDADREIYELKATYIKKLNDEEEINVVLRGENGTLRNNKKKFDIQIEELMAQVAKLKKEHLGYKNSVADLEKDVVELQKEITERDETIQQKEKRISELKKKNQELEKYKFVLQYNIRELKDQIEPRERKIHDQKEQIEDMITELENLQKKIATLQLQLTELQEKLNSSNNEYKREQAKYRQANNILKAIRTDLHNVTNLIQEPTLLKTALKKMHHKFNADKEFVIAQTEDTDVKTEFFRQRDYLEKMIADLKKHGEKRHTDTDADKFKIIEESSQLIAETNKLRKEVKTLCTDNKKIKTLLGVNNKYMQPKEAQEYLAEVVKTKEEIHSDYQEKLQNSDKCIQSLKEENRRLLAKLQCQVQSRHGSK